MQLPKWCTYWEGSIKESDHFEHGVGWPTGICSLGEQAFRRYAHILGYELVAIGYIVRIWRCGFDLLSKDADVFNYRLRQLEVSFSCLSKCVLLPRDLHTQITTVVINAPLHAASYRPSFRSTVRKPHAPPALPRHIPPICQLIWSCLNSNCSAQP